MDDPKYVGLTPVTNADKDGYYEKALDFAIDKNNKDITNVALTGPNGSGKSSVIKSFEKKKGRKVKFVNVSLATFSNIASVEKDDLLLERSILQQLFYKQSSELLPQSRFKRISKVRRPFFKGTLVFIWLSSLFGLIFQKQLVLNYADGISTNLLLWFLLTFSLSGFVLLFADLYRIFKRNLVNKINIASVQIELKDCSESSILNKHIDEILYYFEVTRIDVVVIEDLDRHEHPKIFLKLREINTLINNCDDVRQKVVFIYAVKDELFIDNDRTKFFDFIIPVIPVINSSNSVEKFKVRIRANDSKQEIKQQFIKEVSIYIDDLRIINNLVNEWIIYKQHNSRIDLEPTKLLAMIIYKNIYPVDFAKLHCGKGMVYETISSMEDFVEEQRELFNKKIAALNAEIDKFSQEHIEAVEELKSIYIAKLFEYTPQNEAIKMITINNVLVSFFDLRSPENFPLLMQENNITGVRQNGSLVQFGVSFSEIEFDVDTTKTYINRESIIDAKQSGRVSSINAQIAELKEQIICLPNLVLADFLQDKPELLLNADGSDLKQKELLRYLLRNGHIDEHYHDYISIFYEGSLTTDDKNFIRAVRDLRCLSPLHLLTNFEEVISELRPTQFGEKYTLNHSLLNYLLINATEHSSPLTSMLNFLNLNSNTEIGFISNHLNLFPDSNHFINALCNKGYAISLRIFSMVYEDISSKLVIANHIIQELGHDELGKLNHDQILSNFIAEHPELISSFSEGSRVKAMEALKYLEVSFTDINDLKFDEQFLSFVYENDLYEINPNNINFIFQKYSNEFDRKRSPSFNLTLIKGSNLKSLTDYVVGNIEIYLENIFLTRSSGNSETILTLTELLKNIDISPEIRSRVIEQESFLLTNFDELPKDIWGALLKYSKVKLTWHQLMDYLIFIEEPDEIMLAILNDPIRVKVVTKNMMNSKVRKKEYLDKLSSVIIRGNSINDECFQQLIKAVPQKYSKLLKKDYSDSKMECLILANVVTLSLDIYDQISESHPKLLKILYLHNLPTLLKKLDEYPVSDDDLIYLITNGKSQVQKMELISFFNGNQNTSVPLLANAFAQVLDQEKNLNAQKKELLQNTIMYSKSLDLKISLLTNNISLFVKAEITLLLKSFPEPFSQIASFRFNPKLNNNPLNIKLSNALADIGYISKVKPEKDGVRVITKRS